MSATTSLDYVVIGSKGWIGSAVVNSLRGQGRTVISIDRTNLIQWLDHHTSCVVIYAVGLTADFRQKPYETVESHVTLLSKVLQRPGVKHLLLLSSTRVYARASKTDESTLLPCLSSDPSDLYNISKLMGESLVLQDQRAGMKVVRLSNVLGPSQPSNTFVGALLDQARVDGMVTIQQPAHTIKNYVALTDVTRLLPLIAEQGQQRLYNLGSAHNTSHAEVATWLQRQGIIVRFASGEDATSGINFPPLSIERLAAEFDPPGDPFRQTLSNLAWLA